MVERWDGGFKSEAAEAGDARGGVEGWMEEDQRFVAKERSGGLWMIR